MPVHRNMSQQARFLHGKKNPVVILINKVNLALDPQLLNDRQRRQKMCCIVRDLIKLRLYLSGGWHGTQQVYRLGMIKYKDANTEKEYKRSDKQAEIQMQRAD